MIEHDMYVMALNDLVFEERENFKVDNTSKNKKDKKKDIKKEIKKEANNIIFNHFCGLRGKTRYKSMEKYLLDPQESFKNKKPLIEKPPTTVINITKPIVVTIPEPMIKVNDLELE
jgi:hypothetical protein